jgi:hypothetical protein
LLSDGEACEVHCLLVDVSGVLRFHAFPDEIVEVPHEVAGDGLLFFGVLQYEETDFQHFA